MEMLATNKNREDTAIVSGATLDVEIGGDTGNTFEVEMESASYDPALHMRGGYIYIPGTEYGGRITSMTSDTSSRTVKLDGPTFRGMLDRQVVEPTSKSDYLTISGALSTCISTLIGSKFGTLFNVLSDSTGIIVSNYKVARYVSVLSAINSLLSANGCTLSIVANLGDTMAVSLQAVKVTNYSDTLEISSDIGVTFSITQSDVEYTHAILLGSGELKNRMVRYLQWNNGNPTQISSLPTGEDVRVMIYDYTSAQDEDDLLTNGKKSFTEENSYDSQSVNIDQSLDTALIGDIIGGRDYTTGMSISEAITEKVVKINKYGKVTVNYKVGD